MKARNRLFFLVLAMACFAVGGMAILFRAGTASESGGPANAAPHEPEPKHESTSVLHGAEQPVPPLAQQALQKFNTSPPLFIENKGQWEDDSIRFAYSSGGVNVGFTDEGLRFQLIRRSPQTQPRDSFQHPDGILAGFLKGPMDLKAEIPQQKTEIHEFSMHFAGSNLVEPQGEIRTESVFHYQKEDPSTWYENVPSYETVLYRNLYDGIDLRVKAKSDGVKYEFIVAPGADWRYIRIAYDNIEGLKVLEDGSLEVKPGKGWPALSDGAPLILQEIDSRRIEVPGEIKVKDSHTSGYQIYGTIDPAYPLVIDPDLVWSTYLGGSEFDWGSDVVVDGSGNVFVTGQTESPGWISRGFDTTLNGYSDGFVIKFSPTGMHVWSSYIGGTGADNANGITVDRSGNVFVVGGTTSPSWAVAGFDTSYNGNGDAFVAKLSSSGVLLWSSYLGGGQGDGGRNVAVDRTGNVFVTGSTQSNGWVQGGYDTEFNGSFDGFVSKLSSNGRHLWSTYIGGNDYDVIYDAAVDSRENILIVGDTSSSTWGSGVFGRTYYGGGVDALLVKLDSFGGYVGSSYLGGRSSDWGRGVTTDSDNNIYITGNTWSKGCVSGGFNTIRESDYGFSDAFVATITSNGAHRWSTYIGGGSEDGGRNIVVNEKGDIFLTGYTESPGWVSGGFDTTHNNEYGFDAFIIKLSHRGAHLWSSYLGGSDSDMADGITYDVYGNVFVTGNTLSSYWVSGGFDTTYNGGYDAFLVKISDGSLAQPQPAVSSSLNGTVRRLNSSGQQAGSLSGATVQIQRSGSSSQSTNTNSSGSFSFSSLVDGSYSVTASKSGYHTQSKQVNVPRGGSASVNFDLQPVSSGGGTPEGYNFVSSKGTHLLEGMPFGVPFAVDLTWNGSPGSVWFLLGSDRYQATISDLGGGEARATITIPAQLSFDTATELRIEARNGEGKLVTQSTGVHFFPIPGIIIPWYQDNLDWALSGLTLSDKTSLSYTLWDLKYSSAFFKISRTLKFDLLAGTFTGSGGVIGEIGLSIPVADFEVLGKGEGEGSAGLSIALAKSGPPTISGFWTLGLKGKAGGRAPAVLLVKLFVPGSSGFIDTARAIPVVGDFVDSLKLSVFLIGGGQWKGEYPNGETGNEMFGAKRVTTTITAGLEGRVEVEKGKAKAGAYAGLTGTIPVKLPVDMFTVRGYFGLFAYYRSWGASKEWATEITFSGQKSSETIHFFELDPSEGYNWKPIGDVLTRWGSPNASPLSSVNKGVDSVTLETLLVGEEECLLKNIFPLSIPSLVVTGEEADILFSEYDVTKPWYQATDVSVLQQKVGGPWTRNKVTDDEIAEFGPEAINNGTREILAVWDRVVGGQIPSATDPTSELPYVEIVASVHNRDTGEWTSPTQITTNHVLDRDPLPLVIDQIQGTVWIQNSGSESIGTATSGDRLMFASLSGSTWSVPVTLWAEDKGVVESVFCADGSGEGHLAFTVDEDGSLDTEGDRELYWTHTNGLGWVNPVRLTHDDREDSLPAWICPDGSATLVWSSSDELMYSKVESWARKAVFSIQGADQSPSTLAAMSLPGGGVIAYTAQTQAGQDIVAAFYDLALDMWSQPRFLTNDESLESSLSLGFDGTQLVMAYQKTELVHSATDVIIDGTTYHIEDFSEPGRTDIYVLRHSLGNDLAVLDDSLDLSVDNPANGQTVEVTATIENQGDLSVEGLEVAFYDGSPLAEGVLIGATQTISSAFIAGTTTAVSTTWNIPDDGRSHQIFVVVDPSQEIEDRDRRNNILYETVIRPDLSLETFFATPIGSTTQVLTARVANIGTISCSTFEVTYRIGGATGEVIARHVVPPMLNDATHDLTFFWDFSHEENIPYMASIYANVDPLDGILESDETNNAAYLGIETFTPGDTDGDGQVTLIDLFNFSRFWKEGETISNFRCDIKDDGEVDSGDLLMLMPGW